MGVMVIMTTLTIILPTDTVDRLLPISVIIVYYTISLDQSLLPPHKLWKLNILMLKGVWLKPKLLAWRMN